MRVEAKSEKIKCEHFKSLIIKDMSTGSKRKKKGLKIAKKKRNEKNHQNSPVNNFFMRNHGKDSKNTN